MQIKNGKIGDRGEIMYLYYIDEISYDTIIKDNSQIILGIYEENCIVSSLFKAMMQQLRKKFERHIIIGLMEKKAYEKVSSDLDLKVYPKLIVIENGKILKEVEGFKNYESAYQEIIA